VVGLAASREVFGGSEGRAGVAGFVLVVVGGGAGLSGGAGERVDAVERGGVVVVPWPAGWEVERLAAGVSGRAAGDGEVSPA